MSEAVYHIPVLLEEALEGLQVKKGGVYADATFGGGGHSRAILQRVGKSGKVFAFDRDLDAAEEMKEDDRLVLVSKDFRYMKNYLKMHDALPVDGVLADLGVASHHFDAEGRGFSTRRDEPLDMRMDQRQERTALDVLLENDVRELTRIFREYGELKNAPRLAKAVVGARQKEGKDAVATTGKLLALLEPYAPPKKERKFEAQVFQALRIEVNQELGSLRHMLRTMPDIIRKGGRLVVISYHSLEDRMVKNFMKTGGFGRDVAKDMYGKPLRPFRPLTGRPVVSGEEELARNPRARSAKLRIAERA